MNGQNTRILRTTAKEPYISAKEPYIFAQQQYISAKTALYFCIFLYFQNPYKNMCE